MPHEDPTRSKELRRRYGGELAARFRSVKGLVRATVEDNDALRVGQGAQLAEAKDDFNAQSRAAKRRKFLQWFRSALREEVLEPARPSRVGQGQHFTGRFVRASYEKGVRHARGALEARGLELEDTALDVLLNRPIHKSTLRMMYERHYGALEGITDAVGKEVGRVLTEGLVQGLNPRDLADEINEAIDDVGIQRARILSQTEVIRTHAEASLNSYERGGVDEVTSEAEFSTAGDSRVCDDCRPLDGNVYTIDEARGLVPVHPRCRCSWIPVVDF